MSAKRGGEERGGKEEKTFFLRASALGWLRMMLCFLHVCRWIACMFRSFSVCTGMAWDDLAGGGLLAPGFLLAGAFFPFAWQHKLRGLSICLKVMDHSAGKFTLR